MRRTKEDSEKTREAILDAAVKIFSRKGVSATTLSGIAKKAGVTRGAIYWHFKNKIDIFDALHERMYKPISELLLQGMEEDHPDPVTRLQEICIYLIKNINEVPGAKDALMLFWVKSHYEGEWNLFHEKHTARKQQGKKLFLHYFAEAGKKGQLPPGTDPEILTLTIGCFMKGLIVEHHKDPDLFDLEKDGPRMIEQIFRGFKG